MMTDLEIVREAVRLVECRFGGQVGAAFEDFAQELRRLSEERDKAIASGEEA